MVDVLWTLQVAGAFLSVLLGLAAVLTGLYSTLYEAPQFWKRLTGQKQIEDKLTQLHQDTRLGQRVQLQQAEAFNELKDTVCQEHDIPEEEHPAGMDTERIERDLLGWEQQDFTRRSD